MESIPRNVQMGMAPIRYDFPWEVFQIYFPWELISHVQKYMGNESSHDVLWEVASHEMLQGIFTLGNTVLMRLIERS